MLDGVYVEDFVFLGGGAISLSYNFPKFEGMK